MTVRYRILYHPEAVRDLVGIYDLIDAYAGHASAKKKLAGIERRVRSLADTPHVGSVRDEFSAGLRAIPAGRKAVVCFTVHDESRTVRIVAFSYAGSDWMSQVMTRL
jgi:plasmid stabilization system protein ParE